MAGNRVVNFHPLGAGTPGWTPSADREGARRPTRWEGLGDVKGGRN